MLEIFIAGVCGAIVVFPVVKWYSNRYKSRISRSEKISLCIILVVFMWMSRDNIYFLEYLFVALESIIYSIYMRRNKRALYERKELKRIIKAYCKYMNTNRNRLVDSKKMSKKSKEQHNKLYTFDEFYSENYKTYEDKRRK